MEKLDLLYRGKAKDVYRTADEEALVVSYRDDATAFNGKKKESFAKKGTYNNQIANRIFMLLEKHHIPTHYIKELSPTDTLVRKLDIIPLEVIIRNIAAGSFSQRYGIPEGTSLQNTVFEFSYKNDALNDPLINTSQATAIGLATLSQIKIIRQHAFSINDILKEYFTSLHLTLVDFKIEFGLDKNGQIYLADEISPDTCRLWDIHTGDKMDKDRFRRDLGGFMEAYEEVLRRILKED